MKRWLFLLLLLVACTREVVVELPELQQPRPQFYKPTLAPEPPAEQLVEVWTTVTQMNENAQVNSEILPASGVLCDLEGQRLQFTIYNPSKSHWYLGKEFPLKPPPGTVRARVLINGIHANGGPKFYQGEPIFGPHETFPENCEGTELLQVRDRVTCTVEIFPLKLEQDSKPNEIQIDTPGSVDDTVLRFYC